MLREFMRLLRPIEAQGSIRWLSRELALGGPAGEAGWTTLRSRGVRAVVHISGECGATGEAVRELGMRYLRLAVDRTGLPEPEELHIVTSWILARVQDSGSVLLYDSNELGNDRLLACAVLVKEGRSADKAQAQVQGLRGPAMTPSQVDLLYQFVAQRAVASNRSQISGATGSPARHMYQEPTDR